MPTAEPLAMRSRVAETMVLLFGITLLTIGCGHSVPHFARDIARICPRNWKVSVTNNVILLRREAPVWIMGTIGRPPPGPDEFLEHYFRTEGAEIHYEVRLRFVPRLPTSEYLKLKAVREEAATKLNQGASGKDEYTRLEQRYEQGQVPLFFTEHYSIFVHRWAEPRFIEVYPPEAASEIESLINNMGKLFKPYQNSSSTKGLPLKTDHTLGFGSGGSAANFKVAGLN